MEEMMSHRKYFAVFVLAALLISAVPALAGGWAVVTLEDLPTQVVAGEPITLEFSVRQHGRTLVPGYEPVIHARNQITGETVRATASPSGQVGHYRATLTLPSTGDWAWTVAPWNGYNQDMPALIVQTEERPPEAAQGTPTPWAAAILGALIAVVSGVFYLSSRYRWAIGLVLAGVVLGGVGVAAAVAPPEPEATTASHRGQRTQLPHRGADLFLAKGCVVCHTHAAVADRYTGPRANVGPNLTDLALPAGYLHTWLRDPASVRPKTEMPNLGLEEAEVDALVAFLVDPPLRANGDTAPAPFPKK
jgi:cytochrome c2